MLKTAAIRPPEHVSRAVFCGVALIGAILLVIAEFSPVVEIAVGSLDTVRRTEDGGDHHGWALLVVALAALPLVYSAYRGARTAAVGLAALGAVALLVGLAVDLPDTTERGNLPESVAYNDARAQAGSGLYLELTGGALLVVSGGLLWVLAGTGRPERTYHRA